MDRGREGPAAGDGTVGGETAGTRGWGRGRVLGSTQALCCVTTDNPQVFLLLVPPGTLWGAPLVWEQGLQHCGAAWGRGELSPALLEAKAELMSRCWSPGTSTWRCWLLPCASGAVTATSFNTPQVDDRQLPVPPCPGMSLAGWLMHPHHPAESGASKQSLAPPDTPERPILHTRTPCAATEPPCLPQSLTL